jgi:hypothetical protein
MGGEGSQGADQSVNCYEDFRLPHPLVGATPLSSTWYLYSFSRFV